MTPKAVIRKLFSPDTELSNQFCNYLIFTFSMPGKIVQAFGKHSHGQWGSNDQVVSYRITKVAFPYKDEEENVPDNVNIYLQGYREAKYGLIYTDDMFEKSINQLAAGLAALDWSEQGMQGENGYVNMDIVFKKR
jgi:hypothetical protein